MAYKQANKVNAFDALEFSTSFGLEKDRKTLNDLGFNIALYYLLSKRENINILKPSLFLREYLDISRSTEWRYRKKLKEKGYI